jgi:hypothetical protein
MRGSAISKDTAMFVRAVWKQQRVGQVKRALREPDAPWLRNMGILGIASPDFAKMTRGLFEQKA